MEREKVRKKGEESGVESEKKAFGHQRSVKASSLADAGEWLWGRERRS
jgi:hypothetical protein